MSSAHRRLLLATHNQGKVRELRQLLAVSGWHVEALEPDSPTYAETGSTFAANARGKASFYSTLTGLPALADDSGLQIDALNGEPGVLSARYIDAAISQQQRNKAVLERLRALPETTRTARFVCHLTLAVRGRPIHEERGECEGRIAAAARGSNGFGYDPIFLRPELGRTFAELSAREKSALSHRGQAVRRMARFLTQWEPPTQTM